jgi:hypothetical protein
VELYVLVLAAGMPRVLGGRSCFATVGSAGAAADSGLAATQQQQQKQQKRKQQGVNLSARLLVQQAAKAQQFEAGLQLCCYGTRMVLLGCEARIAHRAARTRIIIVSDTRYALSTILYWIHSMHWL